jgi:hypothetical protein
MVIPAPDSKPLEVRGADGQVIAYLVPAEQMDRLRAEIASLREQLGTAIRQRDHHMAKEVELLKTLFPLPPTEEEMADPSLWATSDDIRRIIADPESR